MSTRTHRVSLTAEDQLLVACARTEIDQTLGSRICELAGSDVDWGRTLDSSVAHAVAPLLLNGLEVAGCLDYVPEAVVAELRLLRSRSAARSTLLLTALAEVQEALAESEIDLMGLKDVQLVAEAFVEGALRPMGDLDLLVPRDEFARATSILEGLGFVADTADRGRIARRYSLGATYSRHDGAWVDLQWGILEREWDRFGQGATAFPSGRLWEAARRIDVNGRPLAVPSYVDQLLHLCAHLEGHAFGELILLAEVVEYLAATRELLDWDVVVRRASELHVASSAFDALVVVRDLFEVEIPADALATLRPVYRRGGLDAGLYGNLGALHLGIDQLGEAAAPPARLLQSLEREARCQVARAIEAERELDELATAFCNEGGTAVMFDGAAGSAILPEHGTELFGLVELFVSSSEVEHLREVARSAGFAAEGPHELSKRLLIESDDPAVAAHDVEVRLVFDGCDRAAGLDGAGDSIRRTAIASLRQKPGDLVRPRLTVAVHGLESDEILACLAARVGRADHDVLFRATALADAVRRLGAGSLAVSVDPAIDAGVAAAGACFPSLPLVPPTGSVAPPLFVWARHGDRSADAPELRRAYFVAFTVSRLTGFRQRLAYLVRHSVRITRLAAVVGLRAVPRRRRPGNPRDHAYWSHPLDDA